MPQSILTTAQTTNASPKSSERCNQQPSAKSQDLITRHVETLRYLDQQHKNLTHTENELGKYIQELQHEEKSLRLALDQSSTSLKEQREKEKTKKDEEAVARLENVLMCGDSSSDSDGDDSVEIGLQNNEKNDEQPIDFDEDCGSGKVAAV